MSRPLLVTDCDEVLLHMVVPFGQWLDEAHGVSLDLSLGRFGEAMRHKEGGALIEGERVWALLEEFFTTEMHRQYPFPGTIAALDAIRAVADIVVLTNIGIHLQEGRAIQLRSAGVDAPVVGNRGPKGLPLARIIAEYQPSACVFVDDIGLHLDSAAEHAPMAWRLHMVGEQMLAPRVPTAAAAHARIDDWATAAGWILDRFAEGPADAAPAGVDHEAAAMLKPAS